MIQDRPFRSGVFASCVLAAAITGFTNSAHAATSLTEWDFSSANGDEATFNATGGDAANFNVAGSQVTRGLPSAGTHSGAFWYDGWAGPVDPSAFFEFIVKPLAGVKFNITEIDITPVFLTDGPDQYALYSSQDGYTTELDPNAIGFTDLTSSVSFRLHL